MIYQGAKKYPVNTIAVHCSATEPNWKAGQGVEAKKAEFNRWHLARGWRNGLGYHYIVDRDGKIAEGRPLTMIGAGILGFNRGVVHICLVGGHGAAATDQFEDHFTQAQDTALRKLITEIGTKTQITEVMGHNQKANKGCPGFYVPDRYGHMVSAHKPDTVAGTMPDAIIRRGSKGPLVQAWQSDLAAVGFLNGPIDGDFGAGTDEATRGWQRSRGLVADGIVGAVSWRTMRADRAPSQAFTPVTPLPTVSPLPMSRPQMAGHSTVKRESVDQTMTAFLARVQQWWATANFSMIGALQFIKELDPIVVIVLTVAIIILGIGGARFLSKMIVRERNKHFLVGVK